MTLRCPQGREPHVSLTATIEQNLLGSREIVSRFTEKPGVDVSPHLDIEASSRTPFDDVTVRAVEENSTVPKLKSHEFDEG